MKKERRCLKFVGYIYLPEDADLLDNNIARSYMSKLGMGTIHFFDELGIKQNERDFSFNNVGMMLNKILSVARKRIESRLLTSAQRKKVANDGKSND